MLAALRALGRYAEAEERLLTAFEMQERELGDTHAQSQATARALVELYAAWGREADAATWRARVGGA